MKHAKQFVTLLLAALMMTVQVPALTLDSVENTAEPVLQSDTEAVDTTLAAMPPLSDDAHGRLIYFKDYSGTAEIFENLGDIKVVNVGKAATIDGSSCVAATGVQYNPNPVGVEAAPADGGTTWRYTDGSVISGSLTIYAEVYVNNATVPAIYTTGYPGTTWGSYYTTWNVQSGKLSPKTWVSLYSKPLNPATYSQIGLTTDKWYSTYIRSVAVYVKLPDENFYLTAAADDENKTTVAIPEELYYTLPTEFNGVSTAYWTSGSAVYEAGKSINALSLSGKTLYPLDSSAVQPAPELYSETYGQLIYFNNFVDKPISYINVALKDLSDPQVKNGRWSMKTNRDNISAGFELISAAGSGNVLAYTDNAGTPIYGNVRLRAGAYTTSTENCGLYDTFRGTGLAGDSWGSYKTFWTGTWGHNSAWKTATSTKNFWFESGQQLTGIGFRGSSWGPITYISDIALYVKSPRNAFWLTDANGENREFIVAPEDYTFPSEFNGVSVSYWTNGTDLYEAGTTVGIADLADKTFSPTLENQTIEPKNTDEYSIRLGTIRGMRMTSFVNAVQRGFADEYGFIVALADSFGDDYSTLVFPENMKGTTALAEGETGKGTLSTGKKFVYATAYDKAAGTDIHKVGSFGDEDGFLINAVIINISAENYRTQYVARPYLRVGDNYFYGDVMVKSIYDVANALAQDDAYMDSLSDDDWNYINDIIGA